MERQGWEGAASDLLDLSLEVAGHTLLKGPKGVAWTIGQEPGHGEEGCGNRDLVAWLIL